MNDHTFHHWSDHTGRGVVKDLVLNRCVFHGCVLTSTGNVKNRSIVSNLHLKDCQDKGSLLAQTLVEDVVVDGLVTSDLSIVFACAFKHVILKGRIGSVKLTHGLPGASYPASSQAAFDAANRAYYDHVDWALDISHAEFEDFDVTGVPLSLIRRDEETQLIVPAQLARDRAWANVPEFAKTWGAIVEVLLRFGKDSEFLLVAPKRNHRFKEQLAGIQALRRAGLVTN